jgi:hypothetical protein
MTNGIEIGPVQRDARVRYWLLNLCALVFVGLGFYGLYVVFFDPMPGHAPGDGWWLAPAAWGIAFLGLLALVSGWRRRSTQRPR